MPDFILILKYTQFAIFCNGIAMMLMKLGIGLSLLRIHLSKTFNAAVIVCIVLSLLVNGTVFLGTFGLCTQVTTFPFLLYTCFSLTRSAGR